MSDQFLQDDQAFKQPKSEPEDGSIQGLNFGKVGIGPVERFGTARSLLIALD